MGLARGHLGVVSDSNNDIWTFGGVIYGIETTYSSYVEKWDSTE